MKVEFSGFWAECIFDIFYNRIIEDGGDGAGVLVCENFLEASEWFKEWYKKEFGKEFTMPEISMEYDNDLKMTGINYHDSNENFIFSNKILNLGHGDTDFIIKEDCPFGWTYPDRKLLKVL